MTSSPAANDPRGDAPRVPAIVEAGPQDDLHREAEGRRSRSPAAIGTCLEELEQRRPAVHHGRARARGDDVVPASALDGDERDAAKPSFAANAPEIVATIAS